jgi:IPT/TIG domain-containing protein
MRIRKALVRGSIGVAIGLPLAVQLVMPTAASARGFWGPVVSAASPDSGPASGGTTVTITGENLTSASGVLFGNVPASYTIVSNTEIIATSPAESAGTVALDVTYAGSRSPSSAYFTYS